MVSIQDFLPNLDCIDVKKSIQLLEDSWKQTTNCCDKTEMYNLIMELFSRKGAESAAFFDTVWYNQNI